ncbi:PTS system mannose/fructose/N-acetylgalactosamine-transporter subunit IIB [Testudinibacter aquarius]|uniref:PTS N-acetylgalactosamine transporter subunit IIB n=1 Tax=Testudinibacter aquarius TaxID=1524974 RepID=A0A4R3YA44_9PAST|nr:PTS sugar transporter subunit IIB [Testudinibacter aquarius]KAE9525848.1 PTS N-acetylgalactosamine transporter subunit IIB [Testudinibacter aquarius]TCV88780.1 PTS system N-acetylgalactosamine-specific IIB component [Testudinibacter aquarius]TNG93464.1 PTS N-acetylgalactosamine transporter subunit IIB [Testudinibacter aquarius]
MTTPNIKMVRIDERLIHGQGQLWIKNLGVNLVICANDQVSTDEFQQTLMKTVIPEDVGVRFWTIEKTAEVIHKAAPHQTIFVIVASVADAKKLCELGFPMTELNIGNIHHAENKQKISQFIYLSTNEKMDLQELQQKYHIKFNTKTSPVSNDGVQDIDNLLKAIQ